MKKREPNYYQIRKCVFWWMIGVFISLIGVVYFKEDLRDWWICSRGKEIVTFEGMESELENKEDCFLCGHSSQSLKERFGTFDGVGVISLNDWYVLEFPWKGFGREDPEDTGDWNLSTTFGNTGEIIYCSKCNSIRGMASIDITLPGDYGLNPTIIQNNLCQECLDRIGKSLQYNKWKNEKKEVVPLCLVDLKTLEIYSLQDWHRGCAIRDYWIEIEPEKGKMRIELFSLPTVDMG